MKITHHIIHKQKNQMIILIYGFSDPDNPHYDFVLTLAQKRNITHVHGFVSKIKLNLKEFKQLWYYLKKVITTPTMRIEVLSDHALAYRFFLPVVDKYYSKTFNGYDCEVLTIDMAGKFRHGKEIFEAVSKDL